MISICSDVREETNRMTSTSPLQLRLPDLGKLNNICALVCFHKCRSLRKKIDDLRADIFLNHVDILALCETRVFESDIDLNIEGLSLFCADQQQSKHGMALHYKPNIIQNQLIATSISGIQLLIKILDIAYICFVYCSPKSATNQNFANVMQYLQSIINITKPIIIMGDFNQNAEFLVSSNFEISNN